MSNYNSKLQTNKHCYIRISVVDSEGYIAHTRAYFLDELE